MNDRKTVRVGYTSDLTVAAFYSNTFDVIALDESGGEDSAVARVIASFDSRDDARKYAHDANTPMYVIGVRPPNANIVDALEWVALVASAQVESYPTR